MNFRHFLPRGLSGLCLAVAALYLSGCATTLPVAASPKLITENPINKIAVLGDSSVVWPGGSNRSLGLEASKQTLPLALPLVKQELSALGYDVNYVEQVGVGFKNPLEKERWVYPAGEPKKGEPVDPESFGEAYQITDGKPAYVYAKFAAGSTLGDATLNIYDSYDALSDKAAFSLPESSLALLRTETNADTLCLARVNGQRFTAGRKAGAIAMNALTIWFGVVVIPPQDSAGINLVCFDLANGAYLWQGGSALGDPENPVAVSLKLALGTFPRKGETLSPQCEIDKTKPMALSCKPRDEATKNVPISGPKVGAL